MPFCLYKTDPKLTLSMSMVFILKGILLVYDITNGWSFDGIDRWIREIDEVYRLNSFMSLCNVKGSE